MMLPAPARAQSAIAGVVKDTTGAVMPGVMVEAASDALIERSRSVVTDAQGAYKIVDLRPGVYTVTFTLSGFTTFKREGVELPSSFVATIDAELKVGTLAETVTASGESPIVDVQSNTRAVVLLRDMLDAVPNAHTLQSVGQLVVGVTLTAPDVGGLQAMQQTYCTVHGAGAAQTTVLMDGMIINGLQSDGAVQSYLNDAGSQEIVYQTGGGAADSPTGGVRINLIPKEGGNTVHGSLFAASNEAAAFPGRVTTCRIPRGPRRENARQDRSVPRHRRDARRTDHEGQRVVLRVRPSLHGEQADLEHPPYSGRSDLSQVRQRRLSCEQGVDNQTINSALGRVTW
jgi:hypothetical protein